MWSLCLKLGVVLSAMVTSELLEAGAATSELLEQPWHCKTHAADNPSPLKPPWLIDALLHRTIVRSAPSSSPPQHAPAELTLILNMRQKLEQGGGTKEKVDPHEGNPRYQNAKNHTKTKEQRPSRPQNEGAKADS